MKKIIKLTEDKLRQLIRESLNELDWKTYANAAKKAQEFREKNPFVYDRDRGYHFDQAAVDSFNKQQGIENEPQYGGEKGVINLNVYHGNPTLSGSREHNFGDAEGPLHINHNVYHMGKQYGKDGKYGRTRMWDIAHETTPEEFYDNPEMGQKFRDAETEVDNYKNGNYKYTNDKGWHLNESQLRNIIRESIKRVLTESVLTAEVIEQMLINSAKKAGAVREDGMPTPEFIDNMLALKIPVEPGYSFIPLSDDYTIEDLHEVCEDAVDRYYDWQTEQRGYFDDYMY